MVPVRLEIANFLSYGEPQAIDLSNIKVAAIVGPNGAGKSSLLDAITWALFGKARYHQNRELIRKGATSMAVTLVFESDGQLYRVRRQYHEDARRARRATASLEQWTGQKWRPILSDSAQRVTEEIERLLKMDYDTFVNTVFLPQGRSGEFMNLDPAERRDLLAKVLGLDAFEKLAERAKEQARVLRGQIAEKERRVQEIDKDLEQRPTVQQAYQKAQRDYEEAKERLEALEEDIRRLQHQRETLLQQKARLEQLLSEEQTLQRQIADARQNIRNYQRQLERWRKVLANAEVIEKGYQDYLKVQKAEATLSEKATLLQQLERQKHSLEQAIQKARASLETQLRVKETEQANTQQQLAQLQERLRRRSGVEQRLQELQKARQVLRALEQKQRQWQALQNQRLELERRIAQEQTQWAQREGQLQQAYKQWESVLERRPLVEEQIRKLETLHQQLSDRLQKLEELRQQRERLTQQLATLQTQQEQEERALQEVREKLQLLEEHEGEPKCPLCETALSPQKLAALRRRFTKEMQEHEATLQKIRKEKETAHRHIDAINQQLSQASKLQQQLAEVERRLGAAREQLSDILDAEEQLKRLEEERQNLLKERAEAEKQWEQQRKALAAQEQTIGYDPDVHQQWRQRLEQLAAAEAEKKELEQAAQEAQQLQERLKELETECVQLQAKLAAGDYALEEQSQLREVQAQIQRLNYDPQKHQEVRAWLQEHQRFLQHWQDLQTAKEQVPQLEGWIAQEQQRIADSEQRLKDIAVQTQRIQEQLRQLPKVEEELAELQERRKMRQSDLSRLDQELGALRQRLQELAQKEAEKEQLKQQLSEQRETLRDYEVLAEAFGRNGIPKMILQGVVEWLERDANELLARLTQGRMHLRFALETATQKGEPKDTLAIVISDELGDRPYELYSGGEHFRIDFAVRLALARLLAHRSGAPLRTLIIDEGFGSQDKEGLEAMVSTIQSVAKDFSRILVVTHLDELRDQFPVLLEVRKGPQGSTVTVVTSHRSENLTGGE